VDNPNCTIIPVGYTGVMNNLETTNPITLDDLAGMVARGFVSIENRMADDFSQVNNRLDKIETRLDSVEQRLDSVVKFFLV
jgi:uncharacterized protein YpuA (DUF1002 family)